MPRVFLTLSLLFFSLQGMTQSTHALYQVDLIVFTHAYAPKDQLESAPQTYSASTSAIGLKSKETGGSGVYQLLPTSYSSLQSAWNRLNQQSHYQTLFHYTWLQPSNSQRPVELSTQTNRGWIVNGMLRVRQSNYYLLDTTLRFSNVDHRAASFVFAQKQRLKPGVTYYLDHPQAGMLIKVHRV
jgi:hypothetical protein